jgi:hypothetical protein
MGHGRLRCPTLGKLEWRGTHRDTQGTSSVPSRGVGRAQRWGSTNAPPTRTHPRPERTNGGSTAPERVRSRRPFPLELHPLAGCCVARGTGAREHNTTTAHVVSTSHTKKRAPRPRLHSVSHTEVGAVRNTLLWLRRRATCNWRDTPRGQMVSHLASSENMCSVLLQPTRHRYPHERLPKGVHGHPSQRWQCWPGWKKGRERARGRRRLRCWVAQKQSPG